MLPVISKIFSRMIIDRIKKEVDRKLGKGQAGLRTGRGETEQIFILRTILEKVNEWRAPIYTHFVDYEKAFDSVHRESLGHNEELWYPGSTIGVVRVPVIYKGFERAVIEDNETPDWFQIKTGVKQGCVMSGFLFLLAIDWIMKKRTAGVRSGIRWDFTRALEYIDVADDIVFLFSKLQDLSDKTVKMIEEALRVGLKLNAKKCKTLRTELTRNEDKIIVNNEPVEDVSEFTYIGAMADKEGGGDKDIRNRLQKARGAFHRLNRIWSTRNIERNTKIHLFNTLVRPVLLCGSEFWKLTKKDQTQLDTFQTKSLRRILRIRRQQRISNERLIEMTGPNNISCEIRRRRWTWLGHILRRDGTDDCKTVLGWQPEGKRARGRPKTTWGRTVEKERNSAGWTSWNVARVVARDRKKWNESVAALCAFWRGEN